MSSSIRHLPLVFVTIGLAACLGSGARNVAVPCECDAGMLCDAENVCRRVCNNDANCEAGSTCVGALCKPGGPIDDEPSPGDPGAGDSGPLPSDNAGGDGTDLCGNAVLNPGEDCDDGFRDACGSCNETCTGSGSGAACGDNELCPEVEVCDDGFQDACGTCNAGCSGPGVEASCGDGELCEEVEFCDDGFADACGTCNADCSGPGAASVCGDGSRCVETEACDDDYTDACGSCNSTCTGSGTGSVCGDGVTCPQTEVCDDGGTNNCGSCNATCSGAGNGSTCGTQCADGGIEQSFNADMVGCAGAVSWASRANLCGGGWIPCSGGDWVVLRGSGVPTHNYWTQDNLRYSGVDAACSVSVTAGTSCNAGVPMRVCTPDGGGDPEGNTCTYTDCGYEATTPNRYFGGCNLNPTAGTLCCPGGCADGSVEQVFPGGMRGCAGSVTFPNRASLCAGGFTVCSASEWVVRREGVAPIHNYWTNSALRYNDTGATDACAVSTSTATGWLDCGADTPMRVCTASGDDGVNDCNWVNCGYGANTPNEYFGGCIGNTTAGTLCCPD